MFVSVLCKVFIFRQFSTRGVAAVLWLYHCIFYFPIIDFELYVDHRNMWFLVEPVTVPETKPSSECFIHNVLSVYLYICDHITNVQFHHSEQFYWSKNCEKLQTVHRFSTSASKLYQRLFMYCICFVLNKIRLRIVQELRKLIS